MRKLLRMVTAAIDVPAPDATTQSRPDAGIAGDCTSPETKNTL
jgi:hypothetical protein